MLAESSWLHIKDAKIDLIILPWGACEAHNYHLPYDTDNYQVDYVAAESARIAHQAGAKIMVLPKIPFGVNTGQMDITLDMNIYPSTQRILLRDIIETVERAGINKLLVLNGHGGNSFKTMLRELGAQFPSMLLTTCDWFSVVDHSQYFNEAGDHAGELETSVMMHIHPDLVDLSKAGDGKEYKSKVKAIRDGWAWAERRWSQVSSDTGTGNPTASSASKGEQYLHAVTHQLAIFYKELCDIDPTDMYE
ncbi:MAG: creatininase family protein [Bacteroidota bacterium]